MTRRHWTILLATLMVAVAAAFAVEFLRGRPDAAQASREDRPGAADGTTTDTVVKLLRDPVQLPAFTIADLDGKTTSSSEWRGKVVIVNFWATWCPPCRAEIPDLIALQTKYRDELVVVGLSEDEGPVDEVRRFAAEQGINYPIAMVTPEHREIFTGISALPTTFVLDKEGRMAQKHVGLLSKPATEAVTRVLAGLTVNARVERVEDPSKLDLSDVSAIKDIPGVDLAHMPSARKVAVLQALNGQKCTCGCDLTVAKCRVDDPQCPVSLPLAKEIVGRTGT
jgi:thiol-disulfide isomerase/thioredoxin